MTQLIPQLWALVVTWGLRIGAGILIFGAFWLSAQMADKFLRRRIFTHAESHKQDILRFLADTIRIGWIAFGTVTALGTVGINVSAIVVSLGLTGFALGFAMKDAISNLLAGVLLILYRPFRLSDYILVSGVEGKVVDINLRYTVLEHEHKRYLTPNSMLLTNTVTIVVPDTADDHRPAEPHRVTSREPAPVVSS